ncbi:2-C-methyl-D-erythritol 4-phosphate cytidylyltransferase [Thermodesulforhabdus norvegica]|uniref:2-C-methyl-D-erythritol 4-phosphate cytidylyltransferase n=1 Tax=Thermodesulforhabdus norvegica TaxID=39841 RepID=A0A1I4V1L3_9BACT|nr:2-C-methyl-D-erythritol 4-phosphate cytidylyltransferase [Thermodesulforhabdus norvegica]SFM95088.1 2-C-methyl-D-erythritol 4-phosphate cytidylyltransferase [Thermodesulforhabdus norvegica]
MENLVAVIPAAGRGVRFGHSIPKQFVEVGGKPILAWTVRALYRCGAIARWIICLPEEGFENYGELMARHLGAILDRCCFVPGGKERYETVWKGLQRLDESCRWVLIHDGARPFVSSELTRRVVQKAMETGAAVAALPATDTVKNVRGDRVCTTLDRSTVYLVQTPQVFRRDLILEAYKSVLSKDTDGPLGTDDAWFVERIGHPVYVVEGERQNIKITTVEDLEWFRWKMGL